MRLGQMRLQEQAVRQAREVVVVGELVEALLVGEQLRLRLLSLGQVAHEIGDEAAVAATRWARSSLRRPSAGRP